ncbi:hypothetical protein Leryth_027222 [Lithospermum erythrorhizon]|nr:hypothetical protein Leryth_027222 [Lithospermum erythrorhizon]
MGEKEDGLGLSLSLKCVEKSQNTRSRHQPSLLNIMHAPLTFMHPHNSPFAGNAFPRSNVADKNGENRGFQRGFDMNQPALTTTTTTIIECDEEVMVSSPDSSTVSSVSGKVCGESREENEGEKGGSSSFDDDGGEAARKKLRLSKEQAAILEETFKDHHTLNPKQKLALAKQLKLRPRQVEVWFQNRRARTKLKQTEVDCEYLRRCCETLTEENRRLQKEVNELRALKHSPQFYMNMNPPTTLTMCPQCERVNVPSSSSAASTSLTLAPAIAVTNRQQHPGTTHNQRSNSMTPWTSVMLP